MFATEDVQEPGPESGLELTSAICSDCCWNTESCYPPEGECVGHCFCCDIRHRECLGPACKSINTHEQVDLAMGGWKRPHNIDMDLVESSIWWPEGGQRSDCMAMNF